MRDALSKIIKAGLGLSEKRINPAVGPAIVALTSNLMTTVPSSGVYVSETTALNIPTVFACSNVLSQTVACLPLYVKEIQANGQRVDRRDNVLWRLWNVAPNSEMTAYNFKMFMQSSLALWGNAFAEIERNGAGKVIGLWPIQPWRVYIKRVSGEIYYDVILISGGTVQLRPYDMFHVRGLSMDGVVGISPVRAGCEAIGLALAQQTSASKFFSNDMAPSGILEVPNKLDDASRKRIREGWQMGHQGVGNAHKVAVLDTGQKFTPITMPMSDAQMIESRKFSVPEIARMFRMPLHKIQDMSASTNNNIEHQGIEFVTDTIHPQAVNFEQEILAKLILPEEQGKIEARFSLNELMRGDGQARSAYYASGKQWGWLNTDEIRDMEGLNPIDGKGGKDYWRPVNMVPADSPAQVAISAGKE